MYVLVIWTESKTKSVVEEKDLCPNVETGNVTDVWYKDGEKYAARIVKKSHDIKYLRSLYVSTEGEILQNRQGKSSLATVLKRPEMKQQEKFQLKKKKPLPIHWHVASSNEIYCFNK